jgi:hypothetical protein
MERANTLDPDQREYEQLSEYQTNIKAKMKIDKVKNIHTLKKKPKKSEKNAEKLEAEKIEAAVKIDPNIQNGGQVVKHQSFEPNTPFQFIFQNSQAQASETSDEAPIEIRISSPRKSEEEPEVNKIETNSEEIKVENEKSAGESVLEILKNGSEEILESPENQRQETDSEGSSESESDSDELSVRTFRDSEKDSCNNFFRVTSVVPMKSEKSGEMFQLGNFPVSKSFLIDNRKIVLSCSGLRDIITIDPEPLTSGVVKDPVDDYYHNLQSQAILIQETISTPQLKEAELPETKSDACPQKHVLDVSILIDFPGSKLNFSILFKSSIQFNIQRKFFKSLKLRISAEFN